MRKFLMPFLLLAFGFCLADPVKSMLGAYSISTLNEADGMVEVEWIQGDGKAYILLPIYKETAR